MVTTTNGAAGSTPTRGYLGHQRPDWERAALAAAHYEQGLPIAAPTLSQVAFAFRTSLAAVQKARNGHRKAKSTTLAKHLAASSPAEFKTVNGSMSSYEILADDVLIAALSERLLGARAHNGGG